MSSQKDQDQKQTKPVVASEKVNEDTAKSIYRKYWKGTTK